MASEKQLQYDIVDGVDCRSTALHARRRKTIVALGGIALLATGIATGMGLSMFCGDALSGALRRNSTPTTPTSPDSPVHHFDSRDNPQSKAVVGTATRPNKFFGPTDTPAEAKAKHHRRSVEEQESSEISGPIKAIVDSIGAVTEALKAREHLEKRAVWQPQPGLTWTYQLSQVPTASQLKSPSKYNVWDIDLFDTPASTIQTIHAAGSKVVCYLSAGTAENWRSDYKNFTAADIGSPMGDWPGENWINTNSKNVRKIMAARLDLAKSKGCDGVDPDNMDPYNHANGFNLQQNDAVSYMTFLSQQASQRGLAIGLKNAGEIIPSVVNLVQYSVEESCALYDECAIYKPFTDANKPVFHVEYPKGYGVVNTNTVSKSAMVPICACIPQWNFSPIVKNNNLDSWQQKCS